MNNSGYFFEFIRATDEYGFDTSTCLAISEVSEKIGVPFGILLNQCFITMIEYQSDNNYIDFKTEKAIECGITPEELDEICEEFGCEYYNVNPIMAEMHKKGVDHLTLG
ncbi:hypothetical protein [Ruminococcus sp. HUN007]|uniref:hypothetical protein n=1 Tax=Ruminococcus sp. HUN007 TaxID=1514668 RepID=UPI0005D2B208|nr:hypothetical protein [Ruminococcus sp. HUN007]